LTTADAPLISVFTVRAIASALEEGCGIAMPCYQEKTGHPIGISRRFIAPVLAHQEPPGLHYALMAQSEHLCYIETPDAGVLWQANTPAEYEALLDFRKRRCRPDESVCAELQRFFATPLPVVRHCQKVSEVAGEIAMKFLLSGFDVDVALVRSAALLHDLLRSQPQHGRRAAEVLMQLGFEEVAAVVADHMFLNTDVLSSPYEKFIVYIADKLVDEDRRVTLEQRFGQERGGNDPQAVQAREMRKKEALAIHSQMVALIGCI